MSQLTVSEARHWSAVQSEVHAARVSGDRERIRNAEEDQEDLRVLLYERDDDE